MITRVTATNFKGKDIDRNIFPKTLFVGPNGAGKSAVSGVIVLTLMGYIPGSPKTNQGIFAAFGTGMQFSTGVEIDFKLHLERRFIRSADGKVSQKYRVNARTVSQEHFNEAMIRAGAPKVIDLDNFLSLSDQKKIDLLFELFPPEGDVAGIDEKTARTKERINTLQQLIKEAERTVGRLMKSRSELQLPAGTLAEITGQIEQAQTKLKTAQDNLKAAEIEQARAEAAKAATEEAQKQATAQHDRAADEARRNDQPSQGPASGLHQRLSNVNSMFETPGPSGVDALESLEAILKTIEKAGCAACAAKLVCKREMRRYQPAERQVA